MLDQFFEVALAEQQKQDTRQEMVDAFMHFPEDELHKIASGKVTLACYDGDGDWLAKFEGTEFYDRALELEEEKLELDIQDQQQRLAENEERRQKNEERDAIWDQRDAIRLKKRLLELELRKGQLGDEGNPGPKPPEGPEVPDEGEDEEEAPEKMGSAAVNYLYSRRQEGIKLAAARMRESMSKTAKGEWVYGAVPGLFGGGPTGAALGGYLSHDAAQMAQRTGGDEKAMRLAGKESALGQMAGGIGGSVLGTGAGLALSGGDPDAAQNLARLGSLVGGHGGAYLGHRVATSDLREADDAIRKAELAKRVQEATKGKGKKKESEFGDEEMDVTAAARAMTHSLGELAKTAEARLNAGVPFEELSELEKVAIGGIGSLAKGLFNATKAGFKGKGLAKKVGKEGIGGAWEAGKGYFQAAAKKNPMAAAGLAGAAGLGAGALGMAAANRMRRPAPGYGY